MIINFKLFENNEDDENFVFHWKTWARHEINEKVGIIYFSKNGLNVCELSNSQYYGYFLIEDQYEETWYLHYKSELKDVKSVDLFRSNIYDNNLDILIDIANFIKENPFISVLKLKKVIKYINGDSNIKPDIYQKYLKSQKSKKFNI